MCNCGVTGSSNRLVPLSSQSYLPPIRLLAVVSDGTIAIARVIQMKKTDLMKDFAAMMSTLDTFVDHVTKKRSVTYVGWNV